MSEVQAAHSAPPAPRPEDVAACREMLRGGSRTFLAASLLLPRTVRDPACVLYAFCRDADDAIDGEGASPDAVGRLYDRIATIYGDAPQDRAIDRALWAVIRANRMPRQLFDGLIEGLAWDAKGHACETLEDVFAYSSRVAGTVGAMMAVLMGVRGRAALARACDLGVAMQLSNIARDVGEDARMGRLYLPRAWMREAGIDPDDWMAAPAWTPALGAVVERLLRVADVLYARVDSGVAALPMACRPGINAARYLYAEIGHEVRRRGLNSVDRRAVVSGSRKVRMLAVSVAALGRLAHQASEHTLAEVLWLVDAAAERSPEAAAEPGRIEWVIDLFERLERQDRALMQ